MNRSDVNRLASSGTSDGVPLTGRVIETHISWVILSGNTAIKIKKPVRLSFLNFSTLALRKKYCRRELNLNKRWSDIYEKVSEIRKVKNTFAVGGKAGRIVDYAVVMRRVNEQLRMDTLLGRGKVSAADITKLAVRLARVHSQSRKIMRRFSVSNAQQLFNDIGTFTEAVRKAGGTAFEEVVHRSIRWSNDFLAQHARRFQERVAQGFQRDVHGDLHSGNIFLEKEPVIFDCIEFNNRFRQIDILYEIAFLAMDIEAHGHPGLSAALMREYAKRIKCIVTQEDLEILNYFKCLRANVRAKVHLLQVAQGNPGTVNEHAAAARRYLAIMKNYIDGMDERRRSKAPAAVKR